MLARLSRSSKNIQQIAALMPKRNMGAFVNHRNTEDNLEETPFEFTEENYQLIYEKLK